MVTEIRVSGEKLYSSAKKRRNLRENSSPETAYSHDNAYYWLLPDAKYQFSIKSHEPGEKISTPSMENQFRAKKSISDEKI